MSALPRDPKEYGYAGLRLTADEFFALGETADRLELIDGVVCMSPRPTSRHQAVIVLLIEQLTAYAKRVAGTRILPDVDWELAPNRVYAPDVLCYRPGRLVGFPIRLNTPPDLVIEILSPGTKAFDLTAKKDDYERYGVGEYWTVDPADARVRCYRRQGDLLIEAPVTGDRLESAALPGFSLDLKPLKDLAAQA